jgi:iron complex transport system ATP-binding protein
MSALVRAEGLAMKGRLRETSLTIQAGELVCLVGPNGSGKTSLIQAMAGIGRVGGSVALAGRDPRRLGPAERPAHLTYLPATRDLPWPLIARDVIALGGGAADFAELALDALLDRPVDTLSTGERSRVLLARALAPRPKLLLLDEPTANLDPLWQIRLMALVRAELRQGGRAALVAIHDLDAAQRYADRILVMHDRRIVGEGLDPKIVAEVFGIVRGAGGWEPVSPAADPRSSP